jgi:hypothetical protein
VALASTTIPTDSIISDGVRLAFAFISLVLFQDRYFASVFFTN